MALPKGIRARGGATNGASGGARGGSVRDARDVIRGREQRPPNRGSGLGPRILKTSQGLVTNKKVKAISTAQLKNRQTASKKTAVTLTNSGRPLSLGRLPSSKVAVGATIRKSAVINSNPMLQNAILDIAGALAKQRRQTAQPIKRPQFTKSVRPTRAVNRDADVMDVDMDHRGSVRDRSDHRLDRNSALVSTLSRSLADIPRAAPRAFAPERASLSDRMRGRLDQRQDPPCSVLVSNLHPNVSDSDINELFRTIGPIVTSMFLSPGTALVSYHRKNDAVKAVETYHLRLLDGQPMTCVLLSQDMVPEKHQPSIPGSGSNAAGGVAVGRR